MSPVTFEYIYGSELSYVWHTLRRLGAEQGECEDLAHEVFLVVYRRLASYDPGRPVRPWLFGICFRVLSGYRRSARVRRERLDPEISECPSATPSPQQAALRRDERELVHAALAELPMERRAVFILYELDAASMEEISEALGVPRNTCYSHLRRARAAFSAAVKRLRPVEGECQ